VIVVLLDDAAMNGDLTYIYLFAMETEWNDAKADDNELSKARHLVNNDVLALYLHVRLTRRINSHSLTIVTPAILSDDTIL
jgi:hypothetical protein